MTRTRQLGLMAAIRSCITAHLDRPTVCCSAWICVGHPPTATCSAAQRDARQRFGLLHPLSPHGLTLIGGGQGLGSVGDDAGAAGRTQGGEAPPVGRLERARRRAQYAGRVPTHTPASVLSKRTEKRVTAHLSIFSRSSHCPGSIAHAHTSSPAQAHPTRRPAAPRPSRLWVGEPGRRTHRLGQGGGASQERVARQHGAGGHGAASRAGRRGRGLGGRYASDGGGEAGHGFF
jgi:hypothetical protein